MKILQRSFRSDLEDFKLAQRCQDIEDGDKILQMYINDMQLTAWQCKKLFGIGPSRYKRVKTGDLKKFLYCRGVRPSKGDLEIKQAIYNVYINFAIQCINDDNITYPLDFEGNQLTVRLNINDWKSKNDIWKNYCLFHDESRSCIGWGPPYSFNTFITKLNHCKEILDKLTANNPPKKPNTTSSATVLTGYQPINPSTSLAAERSLTVFYFNGIAVAITAVNLK